jgi:hypothetical protein
MKKKIRKFKSNQSVIYSEKAKLCFEFQSSWNGWKGKLLVVVNKHDWLIDWFLGLNTTFSYIMATNFSGGRIQSTRREPPTMGKQLVNIITCGCES